MILSKAARVATVIGAGGLVVLGLLSCQPRTPGEPPANRPLGRLDVTFNPDPGRPDLFAVAQTSAGVEFEVFADRASVETPVRVASAVNTRFSGGGKLISSVLDTQGRPAVIFDQDARTSANVIFKAGSPTKVIVIDASGNIVADEDVDTDSARRQRPRKPSRTAHQDVAGGDLCTPVEMYVTTLDAIFGSSCTAGGPRCLPAFQDLARVSGDLCGLTPQETPNAPVAPTGAEPLPMLVVAQNCLPQAIDAGESVSFSASAAGGSADYTFQWVVDGPLGSGTPSIPSSAQATVAFDQPGSYAIFAVVRDELTGVQVAAATRCQITVREPSMNTNANGNANVNGNANSNTNDNANTNANENTNGDGGTAALGACCLCGGICELHTADECADLNGAYRGDDSDCGGAPCTLTAANDCDGNHVRDDCDLAAGTSTDCNGNGVPDGCEISAGSAADCNANGVPDSCELAGGGGTDCDLDGVPDECERVLYVRAGSPPGGCGKSWSTAFSDLQAALASAALGGIDEIWVAAGTYRPDQDGFDRSITFRLISGVAIYGGFAGGETSFDQRDPSANITTLSGDIGVPGDANDNSFHVVDGGGVDQTAVLDGFVITGGHADGSCTSGFCPDEYGAGMIAESGHPTVRNCAFTANTAEHGGGGVYLSNSHPAFTACTFEQNHVPGEGGNDGGGGIYCEYSSSPQIVNCRFLQNQVTGCGAGLFCRVQSSPVVFNAEFTGNQAAFGAALCMALSSNATLVNCTVRANLAGLGGGIYVYRASPTISNCIFWGDSAPTGPEISLNDCPSQLTISFSDVQGGPSAVHNINPALCLFFWNDGNLQVDPQLTSAGRLSANSPCLDAGNNSAVLPDSADLDGDANVSEQSPFDLDGAARFVDAPAPDTGNGSPPNVDMGAYEYQP